MPTRQALDHSAGGGACVHVHANGRHNVTTTTTNATEGTADHCVLERRTARVSGHARVRCRRVRGFTSMPSPPYIRTEWPGRAHPTCTHPLRAAILLKLHVLLRVLPPQSAHVVPGDASARLPLFSFFLACATTTNAHAAVTPRAPTESHSTPTANQTATRSNSGQHRPPPADRTTTEQPHVRVGW